MAEIDLSPVANPNDGVDPVVNPDVFLTEHQASEDAKLLVRFFMAPYPDKAATEREGRPIHRDTEFIDIRVPGSRDSVCRPVTDRDMARFPRHYAAFKQRTELPVEGTPLVEWTLISRSMAEELAFRGIKTVEQLAELNDGNAGQFMGGLNLKRQAQEWLEDAKADAPLVRMTEELEHRDQKIAAQEATIADLLQRLETLEKSVVAPSTPVGADMHSPLDGAAEETQVDEGFQLSDPVDTAPTPEAEPGPGVVVQRRRRRRGKQKDE